MVCILSAATMTEPSWRPVRRLAQTRSGMTTTEAAAMPIPKPDGRASSRSISERMASKLIHAARVKNGMAMPRRARRSRASGDAGAELPDHDQRAGDFDEGVKAEAE